MTHKISHEECEQRARELDQIAFERGLIEEDAGMDESQADNVPDPVDEELEISDEALVVDANASILIIDDDDQFRGMLCDMLKTAGYKNISEAADGREGLARYSENQTDLIITDMVMPEKLGIDTIVEIINDFPKAKIVALSGGGFFGPEIELDMAAKLGARTFTKPIERKKLLSAIRDLLASPCQLNNED